MEVVTSKDKFRKKCFKLLLKAQKYSYTKDKYIQNQLSKLINDNKSKNIMAYIPLKNEVDIMPLLTRLRRQKVNIWVPFMEGKSFRLVKYRYPLRIKKYGIKEPKNSYQYRPEKIDLALVPIIGMDITCRRIGFGKGMYDRFFEKEIKNIKKIVFVTRVLCYSKKTITNDYDIKADLLITT
jgi:5-formyltetrahydrofolate cyclo-ligase